MWVAQGCNVVLRLKCFIISELIGQRPCDAHLGSPQGKREKYETASLEKKIRKTRLHLHARKETF